MKIYIIDALVGFKQQKAKKTNATRRIHVKPDCFPVDRHANEAPPPAPERLTELMWCCSAVHFHHLPEGKICCIRSPQSCLRPKKKKIPLPPPPLPSLFIHLCAFSLLRSVHKALG